MKLTAKRPVFIQDAWVLPGQPVPYNVPGFNYERAADKGQIEAEDGEDIFNPEPEAEDGAERADQGELESLRQQLAEAQRERDEIQSGLNTAQVDRDANQQRIDELVTERDALAAQLSEAQARPALPADALTRLIDIKGVGEKLAPVILDALTAAPQAG
ncbi:hypothetical protein QR90_06730 [Deinococcus radiopugnans]|uniref:Uncharacterized protein n=1 Tax=Deinococcus radiopugnans TaxID=57497 RepID=A0A0A7KI52_9DEIO|nr:hypothetical protein [Deinococcus radiopugnans]AIZ44864.1 hypothetical protein QR90_06730 [Deinococcus radiopugnans]